MDLEYWYSAAELQPPDFLCSYFSLVMTSIASAWRLFRLGYAQRSQIFVSVGSLEKGGHD